MTSTSLEDFCQLYGDFGHLTLSKTWASRKNLTFCNPPVTLYVIFIPTNAKITDKLPPSVPVYCSYSKSV